MTRPVLARTSSAASGLRFCGMIELPVVKASDSRTKPKCRRGPDHHLLGEARQMHAERSRPRRGTRARSRGRKRRRASWPSARSKPSALAVASRSIGNDVPASAAAPSGHSLSRARGIGEAAAVAPDHLDIGQQVVAEGHRLRRLQMREAGHHGGGVRLGLVDQRRLQVGERRRRGVDRVAHPQAEIGRHLVVARARGVQPPGGSPISSAGAPRCSCGCPRARRGTGIRRPRSRPAMRSSPCCDRRRHPRRR